MKNFIFKSTGADLHKIFQYLETEQKNILYLTYQVDKILKILRDEQTDKGLQKQVDDYYGPKDWERDISESCSKEDKEPD